jgi:hypothetical protein
MFLGFSYTNRNVTQELSAERYRTRELLEKKTQEQLTMATKGQIRGGKRRGKIDKY